MYLIHQLSHLEKAGIIIFFFALYCLMICNEGLLQSKCILYPGAIAELLYTGIYFSPDCAWMLTAN